MAKPDRREQLAKELRDNLKKRKNQARARRVLANEKPVKEKGADDRTGASSGPEQQKLDDE